MPRRQLRIAAKNHVRMRHILIRQILIDRRRVDFPRQPRNLQDALQLARKQQPAALVAIDQRFFPQPIAAQHQPPAVGIPDRNRKHAVQMRKALRPFVLVQMDDRLGVAVRPKLGAPTLPAAAAGRDSCRSRRRRSIHTLPSSFDIGWLARRQIDDRQPPMAQRHARHRFIRRAEFVFAEVRSLAIRPAVAQAIGHPRQRRRVDALIGVGPDGAGDAAHAEGSGFGVQKAAVVSGQSAVAMGKPNKSRRARPQYNVLSTQYSVLGTSDFDNVPILLRVLCGPLRLCVKINSVAHPSEASPMSHFRASLHNRRYRCRRLDRPRSRTRRFRGQGRRPRRRSSVRLTT